MNRSFFALRLIGCLTLCLSPATAQVVEEKVIVGVMQAGGTVIPVARYDGVRWANTWPAPADGHDVEPPAVKQIPREWLGGETAPANWRIWLPSGTSHETQTVGLEYSKTHCAGNWGFMTDFPKALNICRNCCPDALIGVAVSTDRPINTMRPADHSLLPLRAMERAFNETETREIAELDRRRSVASPNYYGPPRDIKARSAVPIRVERAWSIGMNTGETLYYIEANRRYLNIPATNEPGCSWISAFRGWFSVNMAREGKRLNTRLTFTDCDFKGASFVTPMALIEFKAGRYVIVQSNGWESQSYGVLKIESGNVVPVIDTAVR